MNVENAWLQVATENAGHRDQKRGTWVKGETSWSDPIACHLNAVSEQQISSDGSRVMSYHYKVLLPVDFPLTLKEGALVRLGYNGEVREYEVKTFLRQFYSVIITI